MKVVLKGREINLDNALPLKIKDWKALEKAGVTQKTLQESSVAVISSLLCHILQKADSSITVDEVDDLELTDPVIQDIIKAIGGEKVDRPFLTPSTSLPVPMDGAIPISKT